MEWSSPAELTLSSSRSLGEEFALHLFDSLMLQGGRHASIHSIVL